MKITDKTQDDITVIALEGQLDGHTSPQVARYIQTHIEEKGINLVAIDMSKVDYIASAGLRILMMLEKFFKKNSGKLAVFGLFGGVREVFEITGFINILNIHSGESEALASLKK